MISAIQSNSQPTFTSVIPIRVFVNGIETVDPQIIRNSCKKLSKVLAGKAETSKQREIMECFQKHDISYIPQFSQGYKHKPSDIFKYITSNGRHYYLTGMHAYQVIKAGKILGKTKASAASRGLSQSHDLSVAKFNYSTIISDTVNSGKNRISAIVDGTKQLLTLNINIQSKKPTAGLESINFTT